MRCLHNNYQLLAIAMPAAVAHAVSLSMVPQKVELILQACILHSQLAISYMQIFCCSVAIQDGAYFLQQAIINYLHDVHAIHQCCYYCTKLQLGSYINCCKVASKMMQTKNNNNNKINNKNKKSIPAFIAGPTEPVSTRTLQWVMEEVATAASTRKNRHGLGVMLLQLCNSIFASSIRPQKCSNIATPGGHAAFVTAPLAMGVPPGELPERLGQNQSCQPQINVLAMLELCETPKFPKVVLFLFDLSQSASQWWGPVLGTLICYSVQQPGLFFKID